MGKGIMNRGSQVHKVKTKYNKKKKYNWEEDYFSNHPDPQRSEMNYTKQEKKQSSRTGEIDPTKTCKHSELELTTRHNQAREKLSNSEQFNCEGCG